MRNDPRMSKPFIRLGRRNDKGFNTTTIGIRSKVGSRCVEPAIVKPNVNTRRVNNEMNRAKLVKAKFIPFPRLVTAPNERLVALTVNHNHNA